MLLFFSLAFISVYMSFWNLPGFFFQSTEVRKCEGMANAKRIAHTKACRELYLCLEMHTALVIVFKPTQQFSFHLAWQNSIHWVLFIGYLFTALSWVKSLTDLINILISKAWSTTMANQVLVSSLSHGKQNWWRVADAHVPACPGRTILRHCHSHLCAVQGIMSYISRKGEGSMFWCCTTVYLRCPSSHAGQGRWQVSEYYNQCKHCINLYLKLGNDAIVSSSIKVNKKWESWKNEAHTTERPLLIKSSAVLRVYKPSISAVHCK